MIFVVIDLSDNKCEMEPLLLTNVDRLAISLKNFNFIEVQRLKIVTYQVVWRIPE